jgi:hypothetical protein
VLALKIWICLRNGVSRSLRIFQLDICIRTRRVPMMSQMGPDAVIRRCRLNVPFGSLCGLKSDICSRFREVPKRTFAPNVVLPAGRSAALVKMAGL